MRRSGNLLGDACESVSLQTSLVVTQNHCFPIIHLPQGGTLAIEATGIVGMKFEEAVKAGTKEVEQFKDRSDLATLVNLTDMRQAGVQPIDLPKVSDTYLTDLGYEFASKKQPVANQETSPAAKPASSDRPVSQSDSEPNADAVRSTITGKWTGRASLQQGASIGAGLNLQADGQMSYLFEARYANGEIRKMEGSGVWKLSGKSLVMTDKDSTEYVPFEIKGDQLVIFIGHVGVEITLSRYQG